MCSSQEKQLLSSLNASWSRTLSVGEENIGLQHNKPSYISSADRRAQPSAAFTRWLAAISAFMCHFNLGCCSRSISNFPHGRQKWRDNQRCLSSFPPKVAAAQLTIPFCHCLPSRMLSSSHLVSLLIFEGIQWLLCSLETKTLSHLCPLSSYWLFIKMGGGMKRGKGKSSPPFSGKPVY